MARRACGLALPLGGFIERRIQMKNILLVLLSLLIIGIWGCKKEEVVSNQNNSIEESGIGTIEGYVGYFSRHTGFYGLTVP